MTVSSRPLTQDAQHGFPPMPQVRHEGTSIKAPGGYTCWRRWLAGKALPLAFFTLFFVTSSKTLLQETMHLMREGIRLYPLLELLHHTLLMGFMLLMVAAYLTRTQAVGPARGFTERIFPMLVLFAGPVGILSLGQAGRPYQLDLVGVGLLFTLLGYGISLWALWHLRSSFAIMAEARSPVTSGPYQYVRHPLYLGEQLTMLGLCMMIGTIPAVLFWSFFTALQLTRARIEEAKLADQFDDYRTYRERTRFILPGLC
jgi:protein-S-isoprenylcysteine O-methyltransferase Ste14